MVSNAALVMPEMGLWGPDSTFHSRERNLIWKKGVRLANKEGRSGISRLQLQIINVDQPLFS